MNFRSCRAVALASLIIIAIVGCTKAIPASKAETKATTTNPLEITATRDLLNQLKLGQPSWASVGASQTVSARLEVDETRITRVGSPVMGRITSVRVHEGQRVEKGQVLATLNSTGLSDAQLSFLKAVSQLLVTQRAKERALVLLKADVIGVAELQRRDAELSQATAELDAAKDQLELLGMPESDIQQLERTRAIRSVSQVIATMDGTVVERKVALGQVIQPADTLFELADLSVLWLVADVPEQSAGNLKVGQTAIAEIAAFTGTKLSGRLSFVSARVNPETRTVRARMELANGNARYKPAMLATVTLQDQVERQQLVPKSAVIREADIEHLFVKMDDDTFLLRPVKLGAEFGANRVLLDGLRPGETIVVDGAFHLNNERRRQLLRGTEGS